MPRHTPVFVYAASPYGFTRSTRRFMTEEWYPAIERAHPDLVLLDPWRHPPSRSFMEIGRANLDQLRLCHCLVAALDGCDVDSGTAAEIGFARALGRPIIGFRHDQRASGDHPKSLINLQVEFFIRLNGTIVSTLPALTSTLRALVAQLRSPAAARASFGPRLPTRSSRTNP
jgi:nucleoside 2-deoxyribosyltransferase